LLRFDIVHARSSEYFIVVYIAARNFMCMCTFRA
jgi:hypothetical protein